MKRALALLVLAGCPSQPEVLWLTGDPSNELIVYLQETEPLPY